MSTGRIYCYPVASMAPVVLDFTMGLQDLEDEPVHEAKDDFALSGRRERAVSRFYHRVTFLIERFCDSGLGTSALERKIASLTAHLGRGGAFGISRDHARSWAGLATLSPSPGDTSIATGGNGFLSWSASAALASGDEVWIEGPGPSWPSEITTLTGAPASDGTVTLSEALRYSYSDDLFSGQPLIRWRDFFPVCYRPTAEGMKALVSWDKRRTYTFKLTFEYCPADAIRLWPTHFSGPLAIPGVDFSGLGVGSVWDPGPLGTGDPAAPRTFSSGPALGRPIARTTGA